MLKHEQLLDKGLEQLGITISSQQQQQLLEFTAMLNKWNQAFNLTAVKGLEQMVVRHLLDSLVVSPYLHGERLIDVGTGAGLPGIPLSIIHPEKMFYLLDSNQKKQIFVSQVVKSLSLNHVQCVNSTVERYQAEQKFSTILTRAFAPLEKMIALTSHLLAPDGHFLAMMGKVSTQELTVPPGYQVLQVTPLKVPFESGDRHVAIITKGLST